MYLELDNGLDAFLSIDKINPYKTYMFSKSHLDIQSKRNQRKQDVMELYKLGDKLDVIIDKVTFEDKTIHVYTFAYKQYLDQMEKYNIELDFEKSKERNKKDYSRFKEKKDRRNKGSKPEYKKYFKNTNVKKGSNKKYGKRK